MAFYIAILILVAAPFAFGMRAAFAANIRPIKAGKVLWNLFGSWIAVGGTFAIGAASNAFLASMGCVGGKTLENCDGLFADVSFLLVWASAFALPLGGVIAFAFILVTLLVFLTPRSGV
ncbi:MAG: hypothetical protein JXR75_04540 [Rhodobacteraceae bacterium]|nr:hypothetical protein [Paracoccaceae bacterium]